MFLWFQLFILETFALLLLLGILFVLVLFICESLVSVSELAFVILYQEIKRSRAIASALCARMGSNSDNSYTVKLSEVVVLVLF